MNNLQCAQDELLREAAKSGNQICKLKNSAGDVVKVQRGYSHPEDVRTLYLEAIAQLVAEGKVKQILQNKDLELYVVLNNSGHIACKAQAREALLTEAELTGVVYKIHSRDGEFVQVGSRTFCDVDEERILFLKVLYELFRHGQLKMVWDSKELCRYEIERPRVAVYSAPSNLRSLESSSYAA